MGAMDFIKKPFIPEVMINRIENILALSELMHSLEQKVIEKTRQIEQISFETIATIASMIEAKDSYTKGHSVRVAEYSARLAKELGWTEEKISNLRYVALLHDIGKVGIPDSVLNKPGKLTEIEFGVIKSHTNIGGDILNDIRTISGVSLGAMYHHERYDGKGYPLGVSGDNIPEIARLICIADAYDAMEIEAG
jgi:putative two-component system response regulator